jgi:hypothetical protein
MRKLLVVLGALLVVSTGEAGAQSESMAGEGAPCNEICVRILSDEGEVIGHGCRLAAATTPGAIRNCSYLAGQPTCNGDNTCDAGGGGYAILDAEGALLDVGRGCLRLVAMQVNRESVLTAAATVPTREWPAQEPVEG